MREGGLETKTEKKGYPVVVGDKKQKLRTGDSGSGWYKPISQGLKENGTERKRSVLIWTYYLGKQLRWSVISS